MGFESWDREKLRAVSSQGGKAVAKKGTGYKWNREAAKAAGSKGGKAVAAKKQKEREETP